MNNYSRAISFNDLYTYYLLNININYFIFIRKRLFNYYYFPIKMFKIKVYVKTFTFLEINKFVIDTPFHRKSFA